MPTTVLPTAYPQGVVPTDPLRAVPAPRRVPAAGLDPNTGGGAGSAADYLLEQMPFQRMEQLAQRAAQPPQPPQQLTLPGFDQLSKPAPEPVQLSSEDALRQVADGTRGIGETVGDTLLGIGAGLGGLVEAAGGIAALVGLADPDNAVSRFGRDTVEGLRGAQSEELRARRELRDRAIAEADTVGGEFAAAIVGTFGSPSLLVDLIAEMAPGVGVSGVVGRGARAITARVASENIARTTGVSAAVASNAVQQGGSVAAEVGHEMKGWNDSQWMRSGEYAQRIETEDPEAVKADMIQRAMAESFAGSAALTVAVAGLPGGRAIERWSANIPAQAAANSQGLIRRIGQSGLARTSLGAAGESVGEGVEEGGGVYLGGLAQQRVDPLVDPWEGVGGAAGLGVAGGGPLGGVAGYVNRPGALPAETPPADVPPADAPPADALPADAPPGDSGAINVPPAGFDSAPPDLPTGLDAMSAAERSRLFTRLNRDIAPVNAALAEAGLFMRDENDAPIVDAEGNPIPFNFTAATFANDPQGVISTLRELGVEPELVNTLTNLANDLSRRGTAATRRAEVAAAADPFTREFVVALRGAGDSNSLATFAAAMGWSMADVDSLIAAPAADVDPVDQPAAFRQRLVEAMAKVREEGRRESSEVAARLLELRRAREEQLQTQFEALDAEDRAAAPEEDFEASRERELNRLVSSTPVIDGPGSFSPAAPEAEALYGRMTKNGQAPVFTEEQGRQMGDPAADARFANAWRRGHTSLVQDMLLRAGRTGFLRDFDAVVAAQRRTLTTPPSVPPPPTDPLATPVQGDLFDPLRTEAEIPKR